MPTRGSGEFNRHFATPKHWHADVTCTTHFLSMGVFRDPLTLSAEHEVDYLSRTCRCGAEGFSFPEYLLPQFTRECSNVPLMTMVKTVSWIFFAVVGITSFFDGSGVAFELLSDLKIRSTT